MLEYKKCELCQRKCGVDRAVARGYCRVSDKLFVSRAALHYWEEPIISGERGSGTIFFAGCSLGCVYCQNKEISRGQSGREITTERLAEIMLELEGQGAHNVNFVTPTHYAPSIIEATKLAREQGLKIPTVYNTSSYDTEDTIKALSDTVDIYLPDLKYYRAETAKKYSFAEDYPIAARLAIDAMVKQKGRAKLGKDGMLKSGVVVRILLLPGHIAEAKLNVKYLYDTYGDVIYISLMSQYTPPSGMIPPLNRRVTSGEYYELCEYAQKLGVKRGFTQEFESASENFIPRFDNKGVLKS